MQKHYQISITGRVQGVGFRFEAYGQFVDLGIKGKADNQKDGSVLLDFECDEEKMNMLLEWCKKGPESARVENVEVKEIVEAFVPLKNS